MAPARVTVLIVHPEDSILDRFRGIAADAAPEAEIQCCRQMPGQTAGLPPCTLLIAHEISRMPDGNSLFDCLSSQPAAQTVILISDRGSVQRAVASVRFGASDYLLKDAPAEQVRASVAHGLNNPPTPAPAKRRQAVRGDSRPIITQAAAMQQLLDTAERVAGADATVLIEGESGTGKELLARFIHQKSPRGRRPFFAMNCAALPEHLAESELFGYEKGAFTGAAQKRAGKFEQADGSTLLLDEISEMPLALQVKLLRVLQEKVVDHIGGKTPIAVDTRIVATTNRNLTQMVKAGKFREDLFYRLRVIPLKIPSLRERPGDVELLANHFLDKHRPGQMAHGPRLSNAAIQMLSNWPWPGNVRELENTIERAVLISQDPIIEPGALLLDPEMADPAAPAAQQLVGSTVKEVERRLIGETLDHVNQNRTHAAKMLGISIRTLRNKLKEYRTRPPGEEQTAVGGP